MLAVLYFNCEKKYNRASSIFPPPPTPDAIREMRKYGDVQSMADSVGHTSHLDTQMQAIFFYIQNKPSSHLHTIAPIYELGPHAPLPRPAQLLPVRFRPLPLPGDPEARPPHIQRGDTRGGEGCGDQAGQLRFKVSEI